MPGYEYIQSVVRALDILELVGNSAEGVAVSYVARVLELSKQTVHNLFRTMVHKKFLEKTLSPPRYRLGPVMQALRERQVHWMRDFLLPAIPKAIVISRRTRSSVMVSQYTGGEVVGRFISPGTESEMPRPLLAVRIPPYSNALTFNAFVARPVRLEYYARHPLEGDSLPYWKSFDLLDRLLARVRMEGHLAFVKNSIFRAAAPIFDGDKTVVAMISITKPFAAMQSGEAQECIDLLSQAAEELSVDVRQDVNAEPRLEHENALAV